MLVGAGLKMHTALASRSAPRQWAGRRCSDVGLVETLGGAGRVAGGHRGTWVSAATPVDPALTAKQYEHSIAPNDTLPQVTWRSLALSYAPFEDRLHADPNMTHTINFKFPNFV